MLSEKVERIRAEISACDYVAAAGLLEEFRKVAEESWRAAESEERRQQVSQEVRELLEWARTTVMAARSHQQGKILQFRRSSAYLGAASGRCDQLELDV